MTKCNEHMTPDYRKTGYLRVGRNVLKSFFGSNQEQRHLAKVLLCVQTFAYFREGMVCLNEFSYICHAGEWITSYSEIAVLTGLCRKSVKSCLKRLEAGCFLQVKDLVNYKLIILTNYDQPPSGLSDAGLPPVSTQPAVDAPGVDFFSQAMNFYNLNNGQKGVEN